jgi:hypothetical protein
VNQYQKAIESVVKNLDSILDTLDKASEWDYSKGRYTRPDYIRQPAENMLGAVEAIRWAIKSVEPENAITINILINTFGVMLDKRADWRDVMYTLRLTARINRLLGRA